MGHHVLPGNPPIQVVLRRSARARRISLRVSGLDGRVVLTVPKRVRVAEALDFAQEKADWIRAHLSQQPDLVPVATGALLPVEGRMRRIAPIPGRRVHLTPDMLGVPGPETGVPARLTGYLRELARDRLVAASDLYAARLGRPYSGVTLRDTRSRWGSCSSRGGLNYSWRLIMAPPEVLSYVAAHEVAHLAQMNHSPAFWATVEQIHGPYDHPRHWLRQNGSQLHRYRFTD
ncbi:SprT family zinc-dependent metalloprotease [Thalassovita sp.]|uniref:M48 family metallopeptidase n=1 Tax=Thalassovita sp. TaxID=1979401 RepID=UPI0029DE8B19|nr:SprT family zinc-dependent metalloprotease [Thalassovita sp.]